MSTLSIQPTYPIFTETDGQPLEDGYIWLGVANLDPQGNPINVYWDAALTQLAGQPIRTQGGYPVNSGTPARLYVNSDYSIRVMNKNGSTVYSAPAATERYSSELISFIQAGAGAVQRTSQNKMRDVVSLKDFIPEGVNTSTSDCSVYFVNALSTQKPIYIPPGTYRVDLPIATDASPAYNLYIEGASEAHLGLSATGNGQCVIDLSNNTQYFACMGYNSTVKNLNFQNGVDVFHHTSSGLDANTTKLVDVFANNFTGTFFKGVNPGNGSHLSWVRPVIVSNNTSAIVYDSVSMGGGGFDNLYITDGWIETLSDIGFKIISGRFSVNATRFIPYTNPGSSLWIQVLGEVHLYITDTDFGGESSRRILYWGHDAGDITFKNCGLFGTTGNSYAITIAAPPDFITLEDITSSTNPGKILFFDPNMSAVNFAKLAKTKFSLGNTQPGIETNLVNLDGLQGATVVGQAFIDQQPAFVQVSDLVGSAGYPYITGSFSPDFSITNGITDVLGGGTLGQSFTSSAANAYGYEFFNTGPGIATLPDGYLTMEAIVSCNANCFVMFTLGSARQVFLVTQGTHRICMPTFFDSNTTRQIGIEFVVPNLFTLSISQISVFKGNYTSRNLEVMGSAAPTSVTFLWNKGNRVINNNPTIGQPKSWVCTVSGAPGTWVSEGNL